VEDRTPLAVITAKIRVTEISLVLFAQNDAKSAAVIPDVASNARSLAHHVLRIVPGLARTVDNAHYRVQYLVIYYHARSAAQIC